MNTFIGLGLAASLAALAFASVPTQFAPVGQITENIPVGSEIKRAFLTCQETYGGGSTTCGDSSSHYCYDPTQGESCCLLDDGYCKAGDFCAPVAGYCCHNGEDPATCAARLSFTLPTSSATAAPSSSDFAAASSTQLPSTATIQVLGVDTSSLPAPSATVGVLGADLPATTTSAGAMTPDFTALINQTASSATSSAGLPVGAVAFTGAARKMDLGVGIGGLLGVAAVAGWVL